MRGLINFFAVLQLLQLLFLAPATVNSKAILGVDLGSLYMKVALVQRNSPLEIVTNLHSQRKTEQMVLFDEGSRFYGADASSLLARKPHLTPAAMSLMLGRGIDHPSVMVRNSSHGRGAPYFARAVICVINLLSHPIYSVFHAIYRSWRNVIIQFDPPLTNLDQEFALQLMEMYSRPRNWSPWSLPTQRTSPLHSVDQAFL